MKKLLMLTAAFLAFQSLPVFAEEAAPADAPKMEHKGANRMFEMNDTNKDEKISEGEFLDASKKRFSEIDGDHDGNITKDEAKAHHESMKQKWKDRREAMKKAKEAGQDAPVEPQGQ